MLHNIYNLDKRTALSAPVMDKQWLLLPHHNLALFFQPWTWPSCPDARKSPPSSPRLDGVSLPSWLHTPQKESAALWSYLEVPSWSSFSLVYNKPACLQLQLCPQTKLFRCTTLFIFMADTFQNLGEFPNLQLSLWSIIPLVKWAKCSRKF